MTIFIGVDPGSSGALAVFNGTGLLRVFAVNSVQSATRGRDIEWGSLVDWLDEWVPTFVDCHAMIERVGARPGQGTSSMFKFGFSAGGIRGVMAQRRTPVSYVTPVTWKKHFKLGAGKDASRARACELFPSHANLFLRVKDDGVAEAALLAKYGYDTGVTP